MRIFTYLEIRTKVALDLDLQNETNITADEMVGYYNEAVSEAVAEIHTQYEDYFLKTAPVALVTGTATYSLPADIYANKIRDAIYSQGSTVYKVRKIRGDRKFIDLELTNSFGLAMDYRYIILNKDVATGYQLQLVPTSRITGSYLTLWYLRNATYVPLVSAGSQGASDAIQCDIPEFYTFIIAFMKMRCLEKDGADPRLPQAAAMLEHEREMMNSTLSNMIPDDDDEVVPDYSHYADHE